MTLTQFAQHYPVLSGLSAMLVGGGVTLGLYFGLVRLFELAMDLLDGPHG